MSTVFVEAPNSAQREMWDLCLYVANRTPKTVHALANLRKICEQDLAGNFRLEVVDVLQQPERAITDQVVAIPTLVRRSAKTNRRVIGDLSNGKRVLAALGF